MFRLRNSRTTNPLIGGKEKDESGIYHYQKANLKNILHALSALYLLINMVQKDMGVNDILESNLFEIHFNQ